MNTLITLPNYLVDEIISGHKRYEMRKSKPRLMRLGEDGFFVVQKGTDTVKCWCRIDKIIPFCITEKNAREYAPILCVKPEYILQYAQLNTYVYLWAIGKVIVLQDLTRGSLFVDNNPQSFAYTPLSYGESY